MKWMSRLLASSIRPLLLQSIRDGAQGNVLRAYSTAPTVDNGFVIKAASLVKRYPVIMPDFGEEVRKATEKMLEVHNSGAKEYPPEMFKRSTDDLAESALEQSSKEQEDVFKPYPRTTEADKAGLKDTVERKLDTDLYLVLKKGDGSWGFPETVHTGENIMDDIAREALEEMTGDSLDTYPVGRAPCAHHVVEGDNKSKVFFYMSEYLAGEVEDGREFMWLTKEEMKEVISPEVYSSINRAL